MLRQAALPRDRPAPDAVAAVNPPVDLERCSRAIEAPTNRPYQWHYVRRLRNQLLRVAVHRPLPAPLLGLRAIGSVRRFDGLYTAPDAGYPTAEAYYADSSADAHLEAVAVPAAILSSRNDPFVPWDMYRDRPWDSRVSVQLTARGGHCGYWQARKPRFWAASWLLEQAARQA